ncbi:MAG: dihydrolipoyl dehydrogenase [Candidatus Korarchaeota archaeon]|nr:dihydrolipoyl dehydrogenase [Candidatus Korarchaeota archaeon]NIU82975.1 dihydrolipoyl dehydrogenase [Candidatus Thorarchaeota archaeon]NIW13398.1 dihydrolipoyl dehydrogenase [Candidatus Thorarchaeota archaeon]NIW51498.1 dihydrolipoyl dehydrogenase [Candidatus Korarchaeota archaeon]
MRKNDPLLVIGSGPGGIVAALRAAKNGKDVILAEKDKIGGVCVNRGCIPFKSLIHAAERAHLPSISSEMGIEAEIQVNYEPLSAWARSQSKKLATTLKFRLKRADVKFTQGEASFVSSTSAEVNGETITFDNAIIATGSHPLELPNIPIDHEHVLSSADLLELNTLPDELIFIGAGYIGMEVGTALRKLGAKVTIVEMMEQILPTFEKLMVQPIQKKAEALGLMLHLNQTVKEVQKENRKVVVYTKEGEQFTADKCLLAIGRTPHTEGLNLEATEVNVDQKGFIQVDERCQTHDSRIYAIGDVIGGKMLAHKAYNDAVTAVDAMQGQATPKRFIPEVVFTDPQLARVGSLDDQYHIGRATYKAIGASFTKHQTEGLIQIAVDDSEIIKGGQIVGVEASEIIHEIAVAVKNKLTAKELVHTVHVHPTISEGIVIAAENAMDLPPSIL